MSNAKRPRPSEAEPSPTESAVPDPAAAGQETIDPLDGYRKSLSDLESLTKELEELRSRQQLSLGDCQRMESDREALLDGGSDDDATLNRIGHLSARIEILRRKVSDRDAKLQEAEKELPVATNAALSQFAGLHRVYVQWVFESERTKFLSQLGATPGQLALEQITLCSKPVLEAKQLQPNDPEACQRLLDALPADFVPPPWQPSTGQPGASAAPAKPRLYGPYLFKGMSEREIQDEMVRIRTAVSPPLSLAEGVEKLAETHPELFVSEAEVLSQNKSLLEPKTGVYESKVGLIGDTFSTEEEFKAKLAARKESAGFSSMDEPAEQQFAHTR